MLPVEVTDYAIEQVAREKLAKAEALIRALPQVEVQLRHHFADGVYAREGHVKAGTVFLGRVHLQSQINIISCGAVSVLTERGLVHLRGPCTWVSPPGAQRAAFAHEDTIWHTILGTDLTDPDQIFETLTVSTYENFKLVCDELMQIVEAPCS